MHYFCIVRHYWYSMWPCTSGADLHTVCASQAAAEIKTPDGSTICTGTSSLSNSDNMQQFWFCCRRTAPTGRVTPFKDMVISWNFKEKIMALNVFTVFLEKEEADIKQTVCAFSHSHEWASLNTFSAAGLSSRELSHSLAFPPPLYSAGTWHFIVGKNLCLKVICSPCVSRASQVSYSCFRFD